MGIISLFNGKDLNDNKDLNGNIEGIKNEELGEGIQKRLSELYLSENRADQLEEILGLKKEEKKEEITTVNNKPSVKVKDDNIINLNQQEPTKPNDPEQNRITDLRNELDLIYGEAA